LREVSHLPAPEGPLKKKEGNPVSATEVIVRPEQDVAVVRGEAGGVMALALMTEQEFEARLVTLKKGQDRIRRIQRELMAADEDYGTIPGTGKPTLLKPGAEKLCAIYSLIPMYEETWIEGDGETSPNFRCRIRCSLRRGSENGPLVSVGVGAANSWESKHRYRSQKRTCPACGTEGSIRKSRYPDKQTGDLGWYCREENCKANFHSGDSAIVDQVAGTVQNKDPFDVENTVYKMAKKRAYIDATLNATATSGLFTQDLEDLGDVPTGPASKANGAAATAPPVQREPGDDTEKIDSREAYERHGVEPPAEASTGIPCPGCGKPAGASRFPKAGKTHYCYGCKRAFEPATGGGR